MKPPLPQLKDEMYRCYKAFPDTNSAGFAQQIHSVNTTEALRQIAGRVVLRTPEAIRCLQDATSAHHEKLASIAEQLEDASAKLREAKSVLEEFHLRREDLLRQTVDLLRQHLPESQLGAKALEWSSRVPVPAHDHAQAERYSMEAQHKLFDEAVEITRQIIAAQQSKLLGLLLTTSRSCDADIGSRLQARPFRPPEFTPIRYFTQIDFYEQARGVSIAMGVTKNVRHGWLRRIFEGLERMSGVPVEHLTAVAGYESLLTRTRASLQRELAAIAAEQFRRVCGAAMTQVEAYNATLRLDLATEFRTHFERRGQAIGVRGSDLARERRKTNSYAVSAERLLLQADRTARSVLSLTQMAST